jgi:protein TonB
MLRRVFVAIVIAFVAPTLVHVQDVVYTIGDDGVAPPTVVREVPAGYTEAAIQARIQGDVGLRAIVHPNGTITNFTVTLPLDNNRYGLDAKAIAALSQWEFKPGMKDGKPVAVRIDVRIRFMLTQ